MNRTSDIVSAYDLKPHPEGGYYKEVYRSALNVGGEEVRRIFKGERSAATSIYFLLEKDNFSAFHRIKSDETWHFYAGDVLEVIEIGADGERKHTLLGNDPGKGQFFQHTVRAGVWFGSRVLKGGNFSFVGCTVYPGFEFRDFELAEREILMREFPNHSSLIEQMTR